MTDSTIASDRKALLASVSQEVVALLVDRDLTAEEGEHVLGAILAAQTVVTQSDIDELVDGLRTKFEAIHAMKSRGARASVYDA